MEVMKVYFSEVLMMCYSGMLCAARVSPCSAINVCVCTAADVTN